MKDTDLKNTICHIRLPEESKEKIIRNLEQLHYDETEQMHSEEYDFDVIPAKTPLLRYAITAIAASTVLAFTAAGVYVANRADVSPASQVTQQMKSIHSDMFSTDVPVYAVMGVDTTVVPESVTYQILTEEQKTKLSELCHFFDSGHPVQEWSHGYDEADACYLYFYEHNTCYALQMLKDENGQGWIHQTYWTDFSPESNTITIQTDSSVIDEIRSIISADGRTNTISMNYYDAVYENPLSLIEMMCCDTVYTDMIKLTIEMDTGSLAACFMMRNPDDMTSDAKRSGAYFVMTAEQKQQFADLNQTQLLINQNASLHAEFGVMGTISAVMYLENGTYLEFWENCDCILIHNPPSFPDSTFALDVDAAMMEQFCTLFESFKNDSQRHETNDIDYETLLNQMFPETDMDAVIAEAEDIFCNLEQAELYFSVQYSYYLFDNHYASQYYSISEAKQKELAELFANLPYTDMKENYESGGYRFVMYIQDKNQRQHVVDFLFYDDFACAYMTWEPEAKSTYGNCYLELDLDTLDRIAEIISEPEQLFQKESRLFEIDDAMFSENKTSFTDASEMYDAFLNDYNQEHGTQLRFPTEDEFEKAGISESECLDFFHTEFPDETSFFRYVDILAEKGETIISNFHRTSLYANEDNDTEVTGSIWYLYNASGQTYGIAGINGLQYDDIPDLVIVISDDGKEGYITKEDFIGEQPSSPKDAVAIMQEREKAIENGTYVPEVCLVYDSDGATIIGTFTYGSGMMK